MFDDDKKAALRDRPAQHRYAKKELPYSITPIDIPIEQWRKERAAKFAENEEKRHARFNDVVNRLQRSMDSQTDIEQSDEVKAAIQSESQTTRVQRRHYDIEQQRHAEYAAKIEAARNRDEILKTIERVERLSWYKRIVTREWYKNIATYLIDRFLALNFNR